MAIAERLSLDTNGLMPCVARFAFPVEAQFFQTLLVSEGIEAEVHGLEAATTLSGSNLMHSAQVWVAEEDLARASELHREFMASQIARIDDEESTMEASRKSEPLSSFRITVIVYVIVVFGAGLSTLPAVGSWERVLTPGEGASAVETWSFATDGFPLYLAATIFAGFLLIALNRLGRPLLIGTQVWWVLASILRFDGGRPMRFILLEVCGFLLGLFVLAKIYQAYMDPFFFRQSRREKLLGASPADADPPMPAHDPSAATDPPNAPNAPAPSDAGSDDVGPA